MKKILKKSVKYLVGIKKSSNFAPLFDKDST